MRQSANGIQRPCMAYHYHYLFQLKVISEMVANITKKVEIYKKADRCSVINSVPDELICMFGAKRSQWKIIIVLQS
jgi:hypothetical protein